jgi:SEC-C motif-containing protein
MQKNCPCGNPTNYMNCCGKYHHGTLPENALALMRSRYSAYALHLADYIIETTHPQGYVPSKDEVLLFCKTTTFEGLKILKFVDGPKEAYVTFTAYLKQGGKNASFTEESYFVKTNGRWLYKSGRHL